MGKGVTGQMEKKPKGYEDWRTYLVINGVELGEDDPIDEAGLVGHGVVRQGLIELHLRSCADEG